MMNYKFANKVFKIESLYDSFSIYANEYITNEQEDYVINIQQEHIDNWLNDHPEDNAYTRDYIETLVIHKIVAEILSDFNTYIIHGSAVSIDNEGYIFIAPSGVGKSTHVRLLKGKLNNRLVYVNDDKPFIDNNFNLYGSPWDGKERLSNNIKTSLKGIFILNRGIVPSFEKLSSLEATQLLYQAIYIVNEEQALDYVIKLASLFPVYRINVNMDSESIEQTIKLMEKIKYES